MCFSSEHRPPLPPSRKSEERLSPRPVAVKREEEKPKSTENKPSPKPVDDIAMGHKHDSEAEDPWKTGADKLNARGSSASVASSMDDTPMLQKLKDMNKKYSNFVLFSSAKNSKLGQIGLRIQCRHKSDYY